MHDCLLIFTLFCVNVLLFYFYLLYVKSVVCLCCCSLFWRRTGRCRRWRASRAEVAAEGALRLHPWVFSISFIRTLFSFIFYPFLTIKHKSLSLIVINPSSLKLWCYVFNMRIFLFKSAISYECFFFIQNIKRTPLTHIVGLC